MRSRCYIGLFSGALLGAGLALLFAPVTGKEARRSIAHEYEELKGKLKELEKKIHKNAEEKKTIDSNEEEDM